MSALGTIAWKHNLAVLPSATMARALTLELSVVMITSLAEGREGISRAVAAKYYGDCNPSIIGGEACFESAGSSIHATMRKAR